MHRVTILIRYFDAEGVLVFEGEPNLRHLTLVPAHWSRWEIYWDEELVQEGERPPARPSAPERRGGAQVPSGSHRQRGRDAGHPAGSGPGGRSPTSGRDTRQAPWRQG